MTLAHALRLTLLAGLIPLAAQAAESPIRLDTPLGGWRAGDGDKADFRQTVNYPASSVNGRADQADTARIRGEIRALIESRPEVVRVFNLITLQLGPDVMVSVKAEMRHDASALDIVDAINSVEHAMKERFPEIRWSFFEPDVSD